MTNWLRDLLGGDMGGPDLTLPQIAVRCFLIYLAGLIIIRVGKSRILSRASPLDLILAYILGSLLSRGINGTASLSGTVVAVVTLVAIHSALTALACRYHWLGNAVKGHVHLLISDGRVLDENLRRSHLSRHDLIEALRLNANLENPEDVQAAYKERSGEVGIVKRRPQPRIVEIDVRDGIQVVRVELSADG